jgi:16S rRNA G966 N2-methylase RsmD
MKMDEWAGCYREGWQGIITEESFAHPAKVSYSLAECIYKHLTEQGWIQAGCRILDPFGGIGGFALHAMLRGCHFTGCELEEKFVLLARENIRRWAHQYRNWPAIGSAVMLQGDSRRLRDVIAEQCDLCVSSPPYADSVNSQQHGIDWTKAASMHTTRRSGRGQLNYGHTPGQLGAMPEGAFDAVVGSPPYADSVNSQQHGIDLSKTKRDGDAPLRWRRDGQLKGHLLEYGTSPGQLGAMKEGAFDAVVSSPPYGDQQVGTGENGRTGWRGYTDHGGGTQAADSQLAAMPMDQTFWSASKDIVQQCYDLLSPGDHAIWVLKSFVRRGKIVDFPGQWQTLCESVGFITLHEHRAMLVEETEHDTLFNGKEITKKERKSFFRRLHEAKLPSTAINWETVLCMVKG